MNMMLALFAAVCVTSPDGRNSIEFDVCVGTNKNADREHYLKRPRINGDPHGQAPMLWLAGALARFER